MKTNEIEMTRNGSVISKHRAALFAHTTLGTEF